VVSMVYGSYLEGSDGYSLGICFRRRFNSYDYDLCARVLFSADITGSIYAQSLQTSDLPAELIYWVDWIRLDWQFDLGCYCIRRHDYGKPTVSVANEEATSRPVY